MTETLEHLKVWSASHGSRFTLYFGSMTGRRWGLSASPLTQARPRRHENGSEGSRVDTTVLILWVREPWAQARGRLTLPHLPHCTLLPHAGSRRITHVPQGETGGNAFPARASACLPRLHIRSRRERPAPPPRPVPRPAPACGVVVTWPGRALTSRAGRDCAGAEKGAGDSACCVAVREPEAVRRGHRSSSRPTMSSHLVEQPPPLHNNNNNCEEGEPPVPPPAGLNSKRRAGGRAASGDGGGGAAPAAGGAGGRREEKAAHWSRSSMCG